jgi:PAS domain S-box-containing protein
MEEQKQIKRTMKFELLPDIPSEPASRKKLVVMRGTANRTTSHVKVENSAEEIASDSRYKRYNELLQNIYDAALVSDVSGRVVDANIRAVDHFLFSKEELRELSVFDVISGLDPAQMQTVVETLENERYVLITSAYCLRKGGTYFIAEISVTKLQLGTLHLCFFIRDITLRKQQEDMLLTEHNAIQNAGNGIAVSDIQGSLEYFNPALMQMWGYTDLAELAGHDVRALFADAAAVVGLMAAVQGEQQGWVGELKARRRDGSEFDVQVSGACNKDSEGEPVGMVFSFVDISDRKRADSAVREAERNRVMLESLGAACHHLGQPATVLLANMGIMQKRVTSEDPLVHELMQASIDAVETLGKILHKLNTVNEYKTTAYLEPSPDGSDPDGSRIIEI